MKPKPKVQENKSSSLPQPKPQPPKPEPIPQTVTLEMTPKLYNALKQNILAKQNPLVRSHINTYFEWLKTIKPEDIVDGIEMDITPQKAYQNLGANPIRLGIAAARGFLKAMPRYQQQIREIATPELAMLTLKFENPQAYQVITRYKEKGTQYVKDWVNGALEILLGKPKKEK